MQHSRLWASAAASAAWAGLHVSSPIVRAWSRSQRVPTSTGNLVSGVLGGGDTAVVLLHGLGATGDYWSGAYDRVGEWARVIAPDLLGFGRSLDESRASFTLDDHLDALDTCIRHECPDARRIVVVAHSMGSGVALAFAARHPDRTAQVVLVGAPIYTDSQAATAAFDKGGMMGKVFLLDTDWARRLCVLSCAARPLSGAVMALPCLSW